MLPATDHFFSVQPCLLPGGPRPQLTCCTCRCVRVQSRYTPPQSLHSLCPPGLPYLPCPLPCLCSLPPVCDPCPHVARCGHAPSPCQRQSQFPVTPLPICARCRSVRLASASAITSAVARPHTHTHTSTLAPLQLQLSILCVAESRRDDGEARRCEAVDCEGAALLAVYAFGECCRPSGRSRLRVSLPVTHVVTSIASHTMMIRPVEIG